MKKTQIGQPAPLHSKKKKLAPLKVFWELLRRCSTKQCGAGGVGDNYPPATGYTSFSNPFIKNIEKVNMLPELPTPPCRLGVAATTATAAESRHCPSPTQLAGARPHQPLHPPLPLSAAEPPAIGSRRPWAITPSTPLRRARTAQEILPPPP